MFMWKNFQVMHMSLSSAEMHFPEAVYDFTNFSCSVDQIFILAKLFLASESFHQAQTLSNWISWQGISDHRVMHPGCKIKRAIARIRWEYSVWCDREDLLVGLKLRCHWMTE